MIARFEQQLPHLRLPDFARKSATPAGLNKALAIYFSADSSSVIRWLSIEPMLEPIKFARMDLFHWLVIGGSSRSSQTPEWQPPFDWISDLVEQARAAGTRVYFKDNLLGNRLLEMPFDAPIKGDPQTAPDVFHYLGKGKRAELG